MGQFNMYFNQICNLCIWLNNNTRIKCGFIYENDSLHVELLENNEPLYTHHIDGLQVKNDSIIFHDMRRLITYLLTLKKENEGL